MTTNAPAKKRLTVKEQMEARRNNTEGQLPRLYELLLSGKSKFEIVEYAKSAGWAKITDKTIDKYITQAIEKYGRVTEIDKKNAFDIAVRRYEQMYDRAMAIKDLRSALAAQKELCELFGLNKILIEHSGNAPVSINLSVKPMDTQRNTIDLDDGK